jgi:hypothetical protein
VTIITIAAVTALYLYVGALVVRRCSEHWWFYSQLPRQPVVLAVECAAWPLMVPMHGLEYITQAGQPLTRKMFEA